MRIMGERRLPTPVRTACRICPAIQGPMTAAPITTNSKTAMAVTALLRDTLPQHTLGKKNAGFVRRLPFVYDFIRV